MDNLQNENKYYNFGYNYFGPFLYAFVKWLLSELEVKGYSSVFFFSRDGYMMKCAFDMIKPEAIKTEYVYFSRKSIRQALLWNSATLENSLQYLAWERYISFGMLLGYFGFDEQERNSIAKEHTIDLNEDIAYEHLLTDERVKALYEAEKNEIRKKSLNQAKLLQQYLEQIGMFDKCAIVDIGWHGSMQYYLERFAEINKLNIALEGYYVGIVEKYPLKSRVNGFIYNSDNPKRRKDLLCFFGGYEKLFQGYNGSTIGYCKDENNIIQPVLGKYEYENEEDHEFVEAIHKCHEGALSFVSFAFAHNICESDEKLTNPLIRFGKKPTLKDTSLFSFFYTYDGSKRYYTSQKKLWEYKPFEFIHALSNSQWKTGFLKSVFKIPFPYYVIYLIFKK